MALIAMYLLLLGIGFVGVVLLRLVLLFICLYVIYFACSVFCCTAFPFCFFTGSRGCFSIGKERFYFRLSSRRGFNFISYHNPFFTFWTANWVLTAKRSVNFISG
jgi:hypothetical protein